MFKDTPVFSGFSVNDLAAAKTFYGETLGLDVQEEGQNMGLRLQFAGGGSAFTYAKPGHQPASFTILNFVVDDVDAAVDELTSHGVTMEHYNNEYIKTDEKGIARPTSPEQGPTIAWFKDPAGNVLAVLQK